jgi:hypothetical protein
MSSSEKSNDAPRRAAAPSSVLGRFTSTFSRSTNTALSVAFAMLLLCLIVPSAALAVRGHVFEKTFSEPGSAPGQLASPAGVAVNEASGDVYVVDAGNDRVERFSSAGAFLGLFDGSGLNPGEGSPAPAGKFEEPGTIAVDNTCHLRKLTGSACTGVDPSNGDVYVQDGFDHKVVDKFSPTGEFIAQLLVSEAQFDTGVAVDSQGRLWVAFASTGEGGFARFSSALENQFESVIHPARVFGLRPGLALDSAGDIYAGNINPCVDYQSVGKLDSEGNILAPCLFEEFSSGLALEPGVEDLYLNTLATVTRLGPEGRELESFGAGHLPTRAEVEAQVGEGFFLLDYRASLAVDAASETVYVADAIHGRIAVFAPEEPGPPTVEATSVSNVSAESADLQAELNPRTHPGEAATHYSFEYGPCGGSLAECAAAPYPLSAGAGSLPAGFEVDPVSTHLQGLSAATVYHLRVSATNSHSAGPILGREITFTTQPAAPFGLLDGRGWELVSPPDKHGANLGGLGGETSPIEAAVSGDAISYLASSPTEAEAEGNTNGVQILSARGPAGGWSSRDIVFPHPEAVGSTPGSSEYRFFSTDLAHSIIDPAGVLDPSLVPPASEQAPFLRTDFAPSGPPAFCTGSCLRPLVTGAPGLANVPPGTEFASTASCPGGFGSTRASICGPQFLGASPDASYAVLASVVPLVAGAQPRDLYEFSAAAPPAESLRLISALPGGTPAPTESAPAFGHDNKTGLLLGSTRNAISADGRRVVWSEQDGGHHIYLRTGATEAPSATSGAAVDASQCTEPGKACTVQLDEVQGGVDNSRPAYFQLASADGSRVFFIDESRLTPDSGATAGKPDLYEYDLARPAGGRLADLTPEAGGEPGGVVVAALGASEDGSYIYFVADGVLAHNTVENGAGPETAAPGNCPQESPRFAQACNLYLRHGGTTTFIGALSGKDSADWSSQLNSAELTQLFARVSPDGRWLAFMSQRSLTGYDNRDAVSGARDQEVFLYHAPAGEGEAGGLLCASCNPTGARPHGVDVALLPKNSLLRRIAPGVWEEGTWLAAVIPGWTSFSDAAPHQSRYLSDRGRLFFDAVDPLAAADSNGTADVYEYEPPLGGEESPPADTCTAASPTFSPAQQGCVDLISSGTSPEESAFLDASESGSDVFFLTASRLTSKDKDTALDVYDARSGGGEAEPATPAECAGDACQSPVAAPEDPTPGSLTFQGPGNLLAPISAPVKAKAKPLTRAQKLKRALKACAKRPKRQRPACKRRARRAYGPAVKAKKSNGRAH